MPATAFAMSGDCKNTSFLGCRCNCSVAGCRKIAEVVPGSYDANSSGVAVRIDPSISRSALAALQELARALSAGEITQEEADQRAEELPAPAREAYQEVRKLNGPVAAVVASLLTSIAAISAAGLSSRSTIRAAEIKAEATIEAARIGAEPITAPETQAPVPRRKPPARRSELLQSTALAGPPM